MKKFFNKVFDYFVTINRETWLFVDMFVGLTLLIILGLILYRIIDIIITYKN